MSFQNIAIVGAGSWGTALAFPLLENALPVTIWGHDEGHITRMAGARENVSYLPGVALPKSLRCTSELDDLSGADLVLLVTPSKAIREVASRLSTIGLSENTALLSCTKGVERGSGLRMSEIIAECLPRNPVAVLSGPSHAEEVARKMATALVLGCTDMSLAKRLQQAFSTPYFRPYTSDDVTGIELGGALKNIYALAAGVSDGLGLGDNSKAALITRALTELSRLGSAMGGRRETFQGLSGIGDLMVTCFSAHSRNRAVGERLGKGGRLADIVSSMNMVAEGVPTTYSAYEVAQRLKIETPIIAQIRALLDGTISPRAAMAALMGREAGTE
jgi:glycerol-3-phosphate dehydrogenase (NAD(P)+)